MIKGLKKRLLGRRKGNEGVMAKGQRMSRVAESLERYAEAVAFAEAGMQGVAQEIIRQEVRERRRIVVVGLENNFSRPLVDYAVGLAKRLGYEIVALNCVPVGHTAPKIPSPHPEELCNESECSATEGVRLLMCHAVEEGVPFQHVVAYGPPDRCIRDFQKKVRRIEFVLTEPETSFEEHMEQTVPVFCIAK